MPHTLIFCEGRKTKRYIHTDATNGQDPRERVPFACLRLVNPAMSITAGLGILRLSVAAGDVAVLDTRQPSRTIYPVVLHAGPMRCMPVHTYNMRV